MDVASNLDLLKKQLDVNKRRLKKLENHKKSIEPELNDPQSEEDFKRLLETLKRLDRNLQIEYKQRDGITQAINSETEL